MELLLPLLTPLKIALWLIAVNFAAFAAFGIDKARAEAAGPRRGKRRTSEADLLMLALIGGTAGAYAGRKLFRHKTRKQSFSNNLHIIAILQLAALTGLAVFLMV